MDNQEYWAHKTQDEDKQSRKPKGQSRMDYQAYWAHKTQDEDKQSNTMQHRKLKR